MAEITDSRALRIGEVSRATGVNIETIRYYERTGVVPRSLRSESGQRAYTHGDIRRLSFVRRARELGFGLDEIRRLLAFAEGEAGGRAEAYAITTEHLSAVRARIADLRRMARVLEHMAGECSRGSVPECPIIDALFDGRGGVAGGPAHD